LPTKASLPTANTSSRVSLPARRRIIGNAAAIDTRPYIMQRAAPSQNGAKSGSKRGTRKTVPQIAPAITPYITPRRMLVPLENR
jgi:hypothetical protein